jgi:hypothetical protein
MRTDLAVVDDLVERLGDVAGVDVVSLVVTRSVNVATLTPQSQSASKSPHKREVHALLTRRCDVTISFLAPGAR